MFELPNHSTGTGQLAGLGHDANYCVPLLHEKAVW
jgi:hypothetical protein